MVDQEEKFKKNILLDVALLCFTFAVLSYRKLRLLLTNRTVASGTNFNAFNNFLKVNESRWQMVDKERILKDENKAVLVEAIVSHEGYLLVNLIAARHVMAVKGLRGVGLLLEPNEKNESLFRSYGIDEFIYLSDRKQGISATLKYGLDALGIVSKINSINDFLECEFAGIHIGKLVYDTYLRITGNGTLDKKVWRVFEGLTLGLSYCEFLDQIFSTGRFPVLLQSERQFVPGGFIYQCALKNNIETYIRGGGPTSFTLHRFNDLSQAYLNIHRYSSDVFDYVYKNCKDIAVEQGGQFIYNRFAGVISINDIADAVKAFDTKQKVISRAELCERLGWDESKPIVGIMANMLTDGVFTNRWRIFRDNLMWLRNTIQIAREIDDVNWFIKGHPSDLKNNVKTTTKGEYLKWASDCAHVKFLPEDVGSISLPGIVDSILTGHGSAGLEYSIYGIPCVIAGEALYSGRGFVHEPKNINEYIEILTNISSLKKLSQDQIDRAKVFAYVYLILSRVKSNLIPEFNVYQNYDELKLWDDAAKLIEENDPNLEKMQSMIEIQSENQYRHLLNFDWVGLNSELINI